MERVTREQFREVVTQALAQGVQFWEIVAEATSACAAAMNADGQGAVLEPGGGGFGGGGASGSW